MSHCCYGDGWCERCQAYMAPHRPERFSLNAFVSDDTIAWCRAIGKSQGRKPWSWASLAGVAARCEFCRRGTTQHVVWSGARRTLRMFVVSERRPEKVSR